MPKRQNRYVEPKKEREPAPKTSGVLTTATILVAVCAIAVSIWLAFFRPSMQNANVTTMRGESSITEYTQGLYPVPCNNDKWDGPKACTPQKCFRMVVDDFVEADDVARLTSLMSMGMSQGAGGAGGPTIFDLDSGAVSHGKQFISAYRSMQEDQSAPRFQKEELSLFHNITSRVKAKVTTAFGARGIQLTSPCFFSRIDGAKKAKNQHDEYWHGHVDKLQYKGFAYSALLYLNTQGADYEGGTFQFVDEGKEVEVVDVKPKAGRLLLFTSGTENVHKITPVTKGVRHALTIAFTCDPSKRVNGFLEQASLLAV